MILVEAPVSVSYQAVKRGKDSKSMTVVSFFVYTVSAEHQTEEQFWFPSRSYEPVLSRLWPSSLNADPS